MYKNGEPTGARTRDTRLKRPLLYQLSYRPTNKLMGKNICLQKNNELYQIPRDFKGRLIAPFSKRIFVLESVHLFLELVELQVLVVQLVFDGLFLSK